MENIPPITHPEEIGQSDPNTGKDESTGSSPRSLPLMQQTTWSDCSAAQNSIGSSSDFNVRAITRSENPLPTVADATEPSQTNLSTSAASPTGRGGLDPWSADDLPTELTPRSDWVPAAAVLQADPILAQSNDAPVPEVTNDSTITEVVNDSPVPEMTNDNPVLGATNNNPVLEVTNESPARVVTFENPVSVMINEGSYEPSPSTISPNVSNNTVPSYAETADLMPPDEEIYRLRHNEESRTEDWEVLDFCKASRARLYNYYITRVQKLRVLCDQGKVMTDLPVHSEEDYALLRALTRTNGGSRWWTIMIDDLKCPECVSLLKARRKDPKSKCRKIWSKIIGKIKHVCLCGDNSHDFICHHERTDMNKVTRFFHTLGEQNASRMVNIELDTDPRFHVDIDVLASAVYNAAKYFKDTQRISIKFHFHGTTPIEHERVKGIVCSLKKLEAMLPWGVRLHVAGFEAHDECQLAWAKKSRKWWK